MRRLSMLFPLFLLLLTGCYTTRVNTKAARGETHAWSGAHLLWGFTTTYFEAEECPNGLQSAETYFPFWGYFVSAITVGIIVPVRTEYSCIATPALPQLPQVPAPPTPPLPR